MMTSQFPNFYEICSFSCSLGLIKAIAYGKFKCFKKSIISDNFNRN